MQTLAGSRSNSRSWILAVVIVFAPGYHAGRSQTLQGAMSPSHSNQDQNTGVAQDAQTYTLHVNSQLVTLDVVVNGKDGQPVRGLHRDDFTIYEDNVPQRMISFEAIEPRPVAAGQPMEIHSTAELDRVEPNAPVSIIVLDEVTTRFEDRFFARYSLEKYLSKQGETLDQPMMLIARTLDHSQVLHDYTTSKKEILDSLNHHLSGNDWRATNASWSEEQILAEFVSLIEIAKATQGHPGHKSLIWIGRGFPAVPRDEIAPGKDDPLGTAIAKCTNLLRDSRVTLYMIDPAGVAAPTGTLDATGAATGDLTGDPSMALTLGDPFGDQVGFEMMATATGGQSLHGRNDVDRMIGTTVSDGQVFYTMAYRPASSITTDSPRMFRKIRVVTKNPALVATTRGGYYLTREEESPAKDEPGKMSQETRFNLSAASQGLMVFDGIPLTVTRDDGNLDRFHLAFPAASIGLKDDGTRMVADVSLIVLSFDKTGKLLTRNGQVIALHLAELKPDEAESRTVQLATSINTKSPAVRVRFIVLGNSNAKIGADNFFLTDRKSLKDGATGLKPFCKNLH